MVETSVRSDLDKSLRDEDAGDALELPRVNEETSVASVSCSGEVRPDPVLRHSLLAQGRIRRECCDPLVHEFEGLRTAMGEYVPNRERGIDDLAPAGTVHASDAIDEAPSKNICASPQELVEGTELDVALAGIK